jgi:hypothetical protein
MDRCMGGCIWRAGDVDPDPTLYFDADPDPIFIFDRYGSVPYLILCADPDKFNPLPGGPRSNQT